MPIYAEALGVRAMAESADGILWFGTTKRGLYEYRDGRLNQYTIEHGLAANSVNDLCLANDGKLWIACAGGGLSVYDGEVFQRLSREDGLPHDAVRRVVQDDAGDLWLATDSSVVRYQPRQRSPKVRITQVTTDRIYADTDDIIFAGKPKRLAFDFLGVSLTTHPDGMVYSCRLQGVHDYWEPVYGSQREYLHDQLPYGSHAFEVRAVDRDLNYSEPARVEFRIRPAYGQIALVGGFGVTLIGAIAATFIAFRHRLERNRALVAQ